MFFAIEAFFFGGGDQLTVFHDGGGSVAVISVDSQNVQRHFSLAPLHFECPTQASAGCALGVGTCNPQRSNQCPNTANCHTRECFTRPASKSASSFAAFNFGKQVRAAALTPSLVYLRNGPRIQVSIGRTKPCLRRRAVPSGNKSAAAASSARLVPAAAALLRRQYSIKMWSSKGTRSSRECAMLMQSLSRSNVLRIYPCISQMPARAVRVN